MRSFTKRLRLLLENSYDLDVADFDDDDSEFEDEALLRQLEAEQQTGEKEIKNYGYIDPDAVYGLTRSETTSERLRPGMEHSYALAFVFGKDGTLHYSIANGRALPRATHSQIMAMHRQYYLEKYGRGMAVLDATLQGRLIPLSRVPEEIIQFGAIDVLPHGHDGYLISFWKTTQPPVFNELFYPCLNALHKDGYVTPNSIISAPSVGQVYAKDLHNTKEKEITPEQERLMDLRRNLHLLRGDAKKRALKELGLTAWGQKSPTQRGAEEAGLVLPGHKWWAMHSESIQKPGKYINPDIIYDSSVDYVSFIYTPDGRFHTLTGNDRDNNHLVMVQNDLEYYADIVDWQPDPQLSWGIRQKLEDICILGRYCLLGDMLTDSNSYAKGLVANAVNGLEINDDTYLVSFWTRSIGLFTKYEKQVFDNFRSHGVTDIIISTPWSGTVPYADVINHRKELTPEEEEELELRKNLHLLRGDAKKQALKKLGLTAWGTKNKMQKGAEDAGLILPGHKYWAMHSESNNRKLKYCLANINESSIGVYNDWIDPDYIFVHASDYITFIYNPDHSMFEGDRYCGTHAGLISRHDDYYRDLLEKHIGKVIYVSTRELMKIALFGRMCAIGNLYRTSVYESLLELIGDADSEEYQLVTFWNRSDEIYDKLLTPCLRTIERTYPRLIISTPIHGTVKLKDLPQVKTQELTPEEEEELELRKNLHLLRGDAKKRALKKLGLIGGGHKQPWQKGAEDAGIINPGQKYWAMHSESVFNKRLNLY